MNPARCYYSSDREVLAGSQRQVPVQGSAPNEWQAPGGLGSAEGEPQRSEAEPAPPTWRRRRQAKPQTAGLSGAKRSGST